MTEVQEREQESIYNYGVPGLIAFIAYLEFISAVIIALYGSSAGLSSQGKWIVAISVAASGFFTLGFAQIVGLLHAINSKLDRLKS